MKRATFSHLRRKPGRSRGILAFTLVEINIAMAIMMVVIGGTLLGHLTGLRMYELTKAKLGANDMARNAINTLIEEIRSAKIVRVGTGDLTSFQLTPEASLQQGNCVQIHPVTDTNQYVRYYLDATSSKLMRTTNGATAKEIVAEFITNRVVFTAEDFTGTVITNNQNNRVVGLTLQFYQIQYPITAVGVPGAYFDFYQLRTKITRRVLE